MYYDSERKLAFVMPPRTGSTMFRLLLNKARVPMIGNDPHMKPKEAQIGESHTTYGFFRDPLDRYMSRVRYFKMHIDNPLVKESNDRILAEIGMTVSEVKELSYEQFIDFPIEKFNAKSYIEPQIEWLANAKLLDFNNYNLELLRVARMLGMNQVTIGVMNGTDKTDEILSQKVIDFVQSRYADDYRLWQEWVK